MAAHAGGTYRAHLKHVLVDNVHEAQHLDGKGAEAPGLRHGRRHHGNATCSVE